LLPGGDETGRTQQGNNNAYCQDNELSWHDWNLDGSRKALLGFTRRLIRLRRRHPVFRRRQFFYGRRLHGSEVKDLAWFRPDGKEMTEEDWNNPHTRCFGLRLAGAAIPEVDARGRPIVDATFLMLLNAHHESLPFVLPAHRRGVRWQAVVDTRSPDGRVERRPLRGGESYELEGRSLALLRLHSTGPRPGRED
jgi:glycogen operon protein